MNPESFILWFKGYSDNISGKPTRAQWDKIRHELALVFNKVTPYHPHTEPPVYISPPAYPKPDTSPYEVTCGNDIKMDCSNDLPMSVMQRILDKTKSSASITSHDNKKCNTEL